MTDSRKRTPPQPASDSDDWRSRAQSLSPGSTRETSAVETPEHAPATRPAQSPTTSENPRAVSGQWQPLDAATAFEAISDADKAATDDLDRRHRKGLSWVEWGGILSVLGILVTSSVLYWRNSQPVANATNSPPQKQPGTTNTIVNRDPARETTPKEPSKHSESAPATSFDDRKQALMDRVLEDAGDGSFALGVTTDSASEPIAEQTAPASPETPSSESPPAIPDEDGPQGPDRSVDSDTAISVTGNSAPIDPDAIVEIRRNVYRDPVAGLTPQREELDFPIRKPSHLLFKRLYADAFESHQTYLQTKKSDASSAEIQQLLGECVALFEQCLMRPRDEVPFEQRLQIEYTLAGLYRDGGRPYEAAVYAMHVVRFGDPNQPITAAAGTVAFACYQQAYDTGYGDEQSDVNLHRMARVCDTLVGQGIDHSQLDKMRYSTAQLMEIAGIHDAAAKTYAKITDASPLHAKSQLAAGREFWAEAVWRTQNAPDQQLQALVSLADQYLSDAIGRMDRANEVSPTLLAGKLALAQISLRSQRPQRAIQLLSRESGIIKQASETTTMSEEFLTSAHELLLEAYSLAGNLQGVQDTLETLAKRYGPAGKQRITRLYKSLTKDLLAEIESDGIVTASQANQLRSLFNVILHPKNQPSVDVQLWGSQVWSDLVQHAENETVRSICLQQADAMLTQASQSKTLQESERISLQFKRIELSERSGQLEQALNRIGVILETTPNAIDLQVKAAELLSERAGQKASANLHAEAIAGRQDHAIWGWAKLTNTLVKLHLDSDDKSKYFERMMHCAYKLNEARIQQALKTNAASEQGELIATAKKHLRRLLTTFATQSPEWTDKPTQLQKSINP